MNRLPSFFNYKQKRPTDQGYEALQDFFLSWTLRCAESKYKTIDEYAKVNYYAKRMLYALLLGENRGKGLFVDFAQLDEMEVIRVESERQFERIDLVVHVEVSICNETKKYLLNIENKWYTTIRGNQLAAYKTKLDKSGYITPDVVQKNWVIFCDDTFLKTNPWQVQKCSDEGYNYTHMDELGNLAKDKIAEPTGNYLFDEYWFYFHG